MLYVSQSDILKAVTPEEIVDAVESAVRLQETNDYLMPDRMHVDYHGNTLLSMPCFAAGKFGTKLVSVFPGNATKGVPVVQGTMVLNDGETGTPLAMLNGTTLTALRTGAVGALALRFLTPPSLRTAGVVGVGVQGYYQALFATHVRPLSHVYLFDRDPQKMESTITRLSQQRAGVIFVPVHSIEELLSSTGAILTATTSSQPVLPDDPALLLGKHFIAIGSFRPTQRELPDALFPLLKQVYVDTLHALTESGDLVIPIQKGLLRSNQVLTLGKGLITPVNQTKNENDKETTLFKSVGMALLDLMVAKLIYEKALEKGLGSEVEL